MQPYMGLQTGSPQLVGHSFGEDMEASLPPAVITRLNTEMGKALADGATRDKLMEATLEPLRGMPEQFADLVRQDSEKCAPLAKVLNIKAE
jgi:tripartite-type tricarboxylate transporter receptor subunit TctC